MGRIKGNTLHPSGSAFDSPFKHTLNSDNCLSFTFIVASILTFVELIFTFGGTTISPVVVENVVKKEIPFLNHVMLIGDRRHFLVCLLTIKVKYCVYHGPVFN